MGGAKGSQLDMQRAFTHCPGRGLARAGSAEGSTRYTSTARNGIPCPVLGSKELTKVTWPETIAALVGPKADPGCVCPDLRCAMLDRDLYSAAHRM